MEIDNEFEIGDTVYLKTDRDQHERIITGIWIRPNGGIRYDVAYIGHETIHYAIELSRERNVIMATTN